MKKNILYRRLVLTLCAALLLSWSFPAWAISIKEEEKLAREFLKYIVKKYELIDDPTIVGYVDRVGRDLLAHLPSQPFEYHFYVVKEETYNAFAIPAGHIFINSGLLSSMESEDELAGILGHEIAHVVNRHISDRIERSKKLDLATMAGVVAGVFLGSVSGDPSAAQAIAIGSAAAGHTASLAYSREDEAQSDQMGLDLMEKAGYDPQGLKRALKRIRSKQWFGSNQIPTYMMSHPALEERIIWVDAWSSDKENEGRQLATKRESKPVIPFRKITIRLKALYGNPNFALQEFQNALKKNPQDSDMLYGYGLTLAKIGKRDEAVIHMKSAQALNALDPFILTDLGRIYLLDGRYREARNTLEGALSISADNPAGRYYLGRAQMELDQLEQAVETFTALIEKHPDHKQAYYSLGETYGRMNHMPDAHYYLGTYYFKKGEYKTARFHLERARRMLEDSVKIEEIDSLLESIGPLKKKNNH